MTPNVPETTVADLPTELGDGAVLLDVREDDEWAAGHAPQAVHIPLPDLAARLADIPDADTVYVVCRSGGRSARATEFLNANGWNAVNVTGGMTAWQRAERPMTADHDNPTVL